MDATIKPGYAEVPQGFLHYAECGSGHPLLLLHATSRSLRCYRRMMPLLAPHFRTVAVDLPGYGNSHPLNGYGGLEDVAAALVAFLDALGIERAHVFGLHLGNKVGAALAAGWPDRVGDVVLAGQTHSIIVDRARRDAEIERLSRHHMTALRAGDGGIGELQAWSGANATAQALWWTPALLKGDRVRPEDVDDARVRLADYMLALPTLPRSYSLVPGFDMTEAFRRIEARTLLLELRTPQEEHLGPQGRMMAEGMRNAAYACLENADNLVLESRPQEVVDAIRSFLPAGPRR